MSEWSASRNVVVSGPWARRSSTPDAGVDLTDAELVALLQHDLQRGAAKIHDRFAPTVNRLVWRLLGADSDHDDLVQMVFCKIVQHATKLRDPARLGSWVTTTTINTVYEELRKREIRRLFLRQRFDVPFHPDLTHDVEIRDLLLRARVLINGLAPKDRIVFVLHFVDGHTLQEVADFCGYSLRTAKRRLGSVNRRFRKLAVKHPELSQLFGDDTEVV
jgi:RNA polymerase sigma-70 factor (ECF subfamily)